MKPKQRQKEEEEEEYFEMAMIEGDYFEACNCDAVCPCVFLGNPDQG